MRKRFIIRLQNIGLTVGSVACLVPSTNLRQSADQELSCVIPANPVQQPVCYLCTHKVR